MNDKELIRYMMDEVKECRKINCKLYDSEVKCEVYRNGMCDGAVLAYRKVIGYLLNGKWDKELDEWIGEPIKGIEDPHTGGMNCGASK
jgi:hypothetical protein